jgi:hypothetical protein
VRAGSLDGMISREQGHDVCEENAVIFAFGVGRWVQNCILSKRHIISHEHIIG